MTEETIVFPYVPPVHLFPIHLPFLGEKKEERGVLNRRERAFRCGRAEVTKDVEVTFLRLNVTKC